MINNFINTIGNDVQKKVYEWNNSEYYKNKYHNKFTKLRRTLEAVKINKDYSLYFTEPIKKLFNDMKLLSL